MSGEQLRIGVIGLGQRSGMWKLWHQPQGRSVVVAGADILPERIEAFCKDHDGQPFVTQDYHQLLARADVDAVVIMTPDHCHQEHAVAAFEAGKHVFLEKPMAITVQGCDAILDAWKRSGRRLMIGFNMRYMSMIQTMKEIVDSGAIGQIKAVWVRHFVGMGSRFYFHDWHARRDYVNSLLLQKGSHDIDVIHWITGQYTLRTSAFGSLDFFGGDQPNNLTCPQCDQKEECTEYYSDSPLSECAFRGEVDVEDNQVVIMELSGGIKAAYLQCHFTPDYHRNYTFIGTEGRLENSEPEMKVWVKTRRSGSTRELADRTYEIKPAEGGHGGADPRICQDFVEMCLDGKEPLATPLAGRMSVAAGACAAQSLRNGGVPVEVPPYRESPLATPAASPARVPAKL